MLGLQAWTAPLSPLGRAPYLARSLLLPTPVMNAEEQQLARILQTKRTPRQNGHNVFCYWHSGFDGLPGWSRRNVFGWMKKFPEWEIFLLDSVEGSPTHIFEFLSTDYFPKALVEKETVGKGEKDIHRYAADLARLPLLYEYGGAWADVSIMIFGNLTYLFDDLPFKMFGTIDGGGVRPKHQFGCFQNYFILAEKGSPFMRQWHESFLGLWRDRKEQTGVAEYYSHLELSNIWWIDYEAQMVAFEDARLSVTADGSFNGPDYWFNEIFMVDRGQHAYLLPSIAGWDMEVAFDLLTQSSATKDGQELVHRMTRESFMMKTAGGHLGTRFDAEPDLDITEGTVLYAMRQFADSPTRGHPIFERLEPKLGTAEKIRILGDGFENAVATPTPISLFKTLPVTRSASGGFFIILACLLVISALQLGQRYYKRKNNHALLCV